MSDDLQVEWEQKPVLYTHDGTPLRRAAGFGMTQTGGQFPALYDNTRKRPKPLPKPPVMRPPTLPQKKGR